jgi:hypothetical protein
MKQINKTYERPFLLEKTKLDRLLDVIHGRLGEHQGTTKRDDFDVILSGQRHEEMTKVEEVLDLDNSRTSSIRRLLISCCALTGKSPRPEHEIQVDFDGRSDNKTKAKVIVSVRSDDAGWCDRALSEVEEQVERTSLHDNPQRVGLFFLAVSVLIVLLFLFVSSFTSGQPASNSGGAMWLRTTNLGRVEQILTQGHTVTDEEMREIITMQLRNVLEEQSPKPGSSGWTKQKTCIGIPLLVVLGCTVYLISRCYPNAVFLWGDEVERHSKMLQTRRIVWGFIIGGTVFGVLSKFLYAGLFPGP